MASRNSLLGHRPGAFGQKVGEAPMVEEKKDRTPKQFLYSMKDGKPTLFKDVDVDDLIESGEWVDTPAKWPGHPNYSGPPVEIKSKEEEIPEPPYICEKCGKGYKLKLHYRHYQKHIKECEG